MVLSLIKLNLIPIKATHIYQQFVEKILRMKIESGSGLSETVLHRIK